MIIPSRSGHSSFKLPALAVPAAFLALCVWAGLQGCKTVDIDAPASDTTSTTKDSATLLVTNKIEQDPDSITMVIYSETTVDIINAAPAKILKKIAFDSTVAMKVPAGKWKLGYEDHTGILFPMTDANAAAQDWLKAILVKNVEYTLILSSDGNRTLWTPSFDTDPVIQ